MKMTAIEKHFVNHPEHTVRVARRALGLLDRLDIQPTWQYLDIGCGVGAATRAVAEKSGMDATGVDVDPKQIAAANASGTGPRLRFHVMDATHLEFWDAEFDIVATSMAMHHIPGWERVFAEMARVLRPGGHLIYSDLTFPSWLANAGRRVIPFVGLPSTRRIESLAAAAGLTKIHESRTRLQTDFIWRRER